MFWDVYDLWLDDRQAKKVKALRRKSNYYEEKYNTLSNYLSTMNRLLNSSESTYGLYSKTISCPSGNILQHTYYEAKSGMYGEADTIVSILEDHRDLVNQQKNQSYDLYRYYFNRANEEDY